MKKILTRNIGWKILSIGFAILLWLVVLNIEDPIISDEITEIEVSTLYTDAITSINKDFEILKGETITVIVEGNRTVIENLTANDIRAVADMRMLNTLTDSVPIEVTSSKAIEIVRWSPERLLINLEDIKNMQVSVQHQIKGVPEAPYVVGDVIIEPNSVVLTGPESQINRVKSVVVPIEIAEDTTNDLTLDITPFIYDENGNEIPKVTMNIDKVKVVVQMEKQKTIPIQLERTGQVGEDYILTDFSYESRYIEITGSEEVIDTISNVVIDPMDVSELTTSETRNIDLSQYLPEGIEITQGNELTVNISVENAVEKEIQLPIANIDVKNLPSHLQFRYLTDEDIVITLKGRMSQLLDINVNTINARISLTDLDAGEHQIAIELTLPNEIEIINESPVIEVQLEELADSENEASQQEDE